MAARRPTANPRRRRLPDAAFLNVPYDAQHEELFLAFLAGLSGFALIPHATLEIPGSQRRLDRIFHLLRRCRYSFHDLSRVEVDPTPPATPRFNMPFELGLAVALEKMQRSRHEWLVFETRSHRVSKSLSDLAGTDEYVHGGTPRGVLQALTNALVRRRHQPTVAELEEVYRDVSEYASELKVRLRTTSVFQARAFRELVAAAQRSAARRVSAVRSSGHRGSRSRASRGE
jgi:hypothetical protein